MRGFYDPLTDMAPFQPNGEIELATLEQITSDDDHITFPLGSALLERIAAAAPGETSVEASDKAAEALDPQAIGELVRAYRAAERTERSRARDSVVSQEWRDSEIDRVASEAAQRLGVTAEIVHRRLEASIFGLMGLDIWLNKPGVSDICINAFDQVFIEENGVLKEVDSPFSSPDQISELMERLVSRFGVEAPDQTNTIRDWQFEWEAAYGKVNVRGQAVLGEVTTNRQTALSFRKPVASNFENLARWALPDDPDAPMTPQAAAFLRAAIKHRATLVIVGGTGSGKTSLLKALIGEMPGHLRIITCEESQELILRNRRGVVGLLAKRGKKIADLIVAAMRMRPDVLIVGEVRQPEEALAFINAVNTGHEGSVTTVHASSADAGLYRVLNLVGEAGGSKMSLEYAGARVNEGVDIVVFIAAQDEILADGTPRRMRRVTEIIALDSYRVAENRAQFTASPIFGRYTEAIPGVRAQAFIDLPLRCLGPRAIPDRLFSKFRRFGLSREDALALVSVEALDHSPNPTRL